MPEIVLSYRIALKDSSFQNKEQIALVRDKLSNKWVVHTLKTEEKGQKGEISILEKLFQTVLGKSSNVPIGEKVPITCSVMKEDDKNFRPAIWRPADI